MSSRAEIPGSAPLHLSEAGSATPVSPKEHLRATIVLRRRPGTSDIGEKLLAGDFQPVSREKAAAAISADPNDVATVESFAGQYGLHVIASDPAKRMVKVEGTARDFDRAFGIELSSFGNYVSYNGPITVPEPLADVIVAVLGLDSRPVARPRR